MGYGKWIAGGLGWAFGGPIGGLIGYAIGSLVEKTNNHSEKKQAKTTRGDFAITFVVLTAAVMKADGKVIKSELDFVKKYFAQFFGLEESKDMLLLLKDVLKKDIQIQEVATQVQQFMAYESRLQVLHFLFGISKADGNICDAELHVLNQISIGIGLTNSDYISIKNMYFEDTDSAYKILEVEPESSDEDVKKAYKKMAIKYHPDKVSYLGDRARLASEEKFKKLNEAYEKIKKQRNIK